jgi:hypothetical protein
MSSLSNCAFRAGHIDGWKTLLRQRRIIILRLLDRNG